MESTLLSISNWLITSAFFILLLALVPLSMSIRNENKKFEKTMSSCIRINAGRQ
jgi:hypothetical protein